MTTSVHMTSISARVFCSTTLVHAKYHFGTSLCRYWYVARERLSFYDEGLQMLNGCLVCYVRLFIGQVNVLVHDIKHWSPPADQRANQCQQTRHLWRPGLVTGHFGPQTLRYQDTSAPVPKYPEDTSALVPKCPDSSAPRHFGTKTFRH